MLPLYANPPTVFNAAKSFDVKSIVVVPPVLVPPLGLVGCGSLDLLHEFSSAGAKNNKLPLINALLKNSFLSIFNVFEVYNLKIHS